MKLFAVLAAVTSALDLTKLMLLQNAGLGNNQNGNGILSNPLVALSLLEDKDSSTGDSTDSGLDFTTMMLLSGGNMGGLGGGNMGGLLALSMLDKTSNSDDSFGDLMTLQMMNGGQFPQLNYWNNRK